MNLFKPTYMVRPDQIPRRLLRGRRRGEIMDVRTLSGFPIKVDTRDQIGWGIARAGVYEPLVTETIWRLTARTDLALDIGANVGYFAGLLSRRAAETIALEPHPDIARRLIDNATRWNSVAVIQSAASERIGTAMLAVPRGSDVNHGLATLEATNSPLQTIEVPTVTIDDVLGARSCGVMKLDIEGHELSALRGATQAITESRIRDVVFEAHDRLPTAVSCLLEESGYTISSLVEHGRGVALGSVDAAPARWYAPAYLATNAPERARHLVRPNGWHSLRPGR
jgi:FkbM family methyltransferase